MNGFAPGRDLFERLKAEGWAFVDEWLQARESETLHLEFKRKTDPSNETIADADKEEIAKTLSAFANTEGGLLVLGVDAGGGKGKGFDRVTRIEPIANVERFGGALERRLRTLTDPPISGLMVQAVEKAGGRGGGVVAICVPKSSGGPHRVAQATAETNDRYYMRTAAGAQTIPHALLAALFSYTSPPQLEFRARFIHVNERGKWSEAYSPVVEMRLMNRGRTAARRPTVLLFGPPSLKLGSGWPPYLDYRNGRTEDGYPYVAVEPTDDVVVYPGADIVIGRWHCDRAAFTHSGAVQVGFRIRIMSLDTVPVEGHRYLYIPADTLPALALQKLVVIGPEGRGEGELHEEGWTSAVNTTAEGGGDGT